MKSCLRCGLVLGLLCYAVATVWASQPPPDRFRPIDVFELEFVSDPQISPDGEHIVYVRNGLDIMKDRSRSRLWIVGFDGSGHRPLTSGDADESSPRWSPDGTRLAYIARRGGTTQIEALWIDDRRTHRLTHLTESPSGLSWSPDGRWLAFSMLVPEKPRPFAKMPDKPKGAQWNDPPRVIESLTYRRDGSGYVRSGFSQLFVVPAEGGTPRRITSGPYHHSGPAAWSGDSKSLIFSANRRDDWEFEPLDTELFAVSLEGGPPRPLTSRYGPDQSPSVSPDGRHVAYLGFDDRHQGFQVTRLYLLNLESGQTRPLTSALDRSVSNPQWSAKGDGLYFQYSDQGNGKIGFASLSGQTQAVAHDIGGTSLGRPYSSGSFSVARNGRFCFTESRPDHPADLAVGRRDGESQKRIVRTNEDLFGSRRLGPVEELRWKSSFDGRSIQGWIVKPPDFEEGRKYPLILEIHGGPFANYGDRFSAEIQLYAAAGYVVLYSNPRGSTSYGGEFGNLIHHNYPSEDYDDLMSGVDAVIGRGYVDESNLFVTGGSGGGVLSSWIVGKTDRFRAAVVAKPVINWYSFVLTSDISSFVSTYWFPGPPWEHPEHYLKRSPLSLVGNVKTPTMLLTGEVDYRTPMSESEQFYQALKLRKVDAALARIPGASHGITRRPSNLIAKVQYILAWFERYRGDN